MKWTAVTILSAEVWRKLSENRRLCHCDRSPSQQRVWWYSPDWAQSVISAHVCNKLWMDDKYSYRAPRCHTVQNLIGDIHTRWSYVWGRRTFFDFVARLRSGATETNCYHLSIQKRLINLYANVWICKTNQQVRQLNKYFRALSRHILIF